MTGDEGVSHQVDQRRAILEAGLVTTVRCWATERPLISTAWIFGSRAKGTARPDSDLDIAIEVTPEPGLTAGETYSKGHRWMAWATALERATGLEVDLIRVDDGMTSEMKAALAEGVEVFRRQPHDALRCRPGMP